MNAFAYKLTCLTDLHVGSGDVNYNIVDSEVERDPVTGYPMIPASGLKGAMRDHFSKRMDGAEIDRIFGKPSVGGENQVGQYKFLSAYLLSRPLRVDDPTGQLASIPVTTQGAYQSFREELEQFGCWSGEYGENFDLSPSAFEGAAFLSTMKGVEIEGEPTGVLEHPLDLTQLIGADYAVARNLNDYSLPVVARNYLENGISQNLWFEEIVPHGSVFYFLILTPDEEKTCALNFSVPLQIGANASIGRGFVRIQMLGRSEKGDAANE